MLTSVYLYVYVSWCKCNVFCCWFEVNVQSIFIVLGQFSILAPGVKDTFNVKQEVLRKHRSCKETYASKNHFISPHFWKETISRYFSSVAVHIFQAAHGPHDILPCGQKWVILPCASFESTNSDRIEIRALTYVDPGTYQSPEIGNICCPCLGTRCSTLLGLAGLAISVQTMQQNQDQTHAVQLPIWDIIFQIYLALFSRVADRRTQQITAVTGSQKQTLFRLPGAWRVSTMEVDSPLGNVGNEMEWNPVEQGLKPLKEKKKGGSDCKIWFSNEFKKWRSNKVLTSEISLWLYRHRQCQVLLQHDKADLCTLEPLYFKLTHGFWPAGYPTHLVPCQGICSLKEKSRNKRSASCSMGSVGPSATIVVVESCSVYTVQIKVIYMHSYQEYDWKSIGKAPRSLV